jgi:hypothetical protein
MARTDDRFKALVHYVCWKCADDPSKLGAVKLNKILWLAEQESYHLTGKPITAVRYVKRKYGPVPAAIVPALRELENAGILTVRDADHFGWDKKEYAVYQEASGDFLTPGERAIVDEMIAYVTQQHTATSISEKSHDHIWKAARDGEDIPHYTVFAKPGPITEEELKWADFVLGKENE